MDPANGAIRAVVGSRDFALSQYNRAMQPGVRSARRSSR